MRCRDILCRRSTDSRDAEHVRELHCRPLAECGGRVFKQGKDDEFRNFRRVTNELQQRCVDLEKQLKDAKGGSLMDHVMRPSDVHGGDATADDFLAAFGFGDDDDDSS